MSTKYLRFKLQTKWIFRHCVTNLTIMLARGHLPSQDPCSETRYKSNRPEQRSDYS